MSKTAYCPFCKGSHRTKKAFNRCKKRMQQLKWTKDGAKVPK